MQLQNRCGKRVRNHLCKTWTLKFNVIALPPRAALTDHPFGENLWELIFALSGFLFPILEKRILCVRRYVLQFLYTLLNWILPRSSEKCVGVAGAWSTLASLPGQPPRPHFVPHWKHLEPIKDNNNNTTMGRCWARPRLGESDSLGYGASASKFSQMMDADRQLGLRTTWLARASFPKREVKARRKKEHAYD